MTPSELIEKLNSTFHQKYLFEDIPPKIRQQDKITLVCAIHGNQSKKVQHLLSGSGCKQCGIRARSGKNNPEYIKRVNRLQGMIDQPLFKNCTVLNREKIKVKCDIHGNNIYDDSTVIKYQQCPKCFYEQSEKDLAKHKTAYSLYKRQCQKYTNISWNKCQHMIELYGRQRSKDLHLEHDFSIRAGYEYGIPPYIIGHWSNLYLCNAKENLQKGIHCIQDKDLLIFNYNRTLQINGFYWL